MYHLLEFSHAEHNDDILDAKLHIIQTWQVVASYSKFYAAYTVLSHKNVGASVAVTNCISNFSMLVPTKDNVKLANENKGNSQRIRICLCTFTNCTIIYLVWPVYYCPDHPYNTISLGTLKHYVGFQKFTSESLENCDFVDLRGRSWISLYHTKK